MQFTEIEEQQEIRLHIHNNENQFILGANVKKHLNEQLSLIGLDYSGKQKLIFDNVSIDAEYFQPDDVPLMWKNVKILNYKNAYVLQVTSPPVRRNRRDSFRLSVAKMAWMTMRGRKPQQVLVKDISLSGFSLSDSKKELNLIEGDQLSITLNDWGYELKLDGRVVRVEERDDMMVYGLTIRNLCKDLSSYINFKQQRSKKPTH